MKNNSFCVCPLASGSKGNSIFVSCKKSSILIDAGLSGIEIERRLSSLGVSSESLTAIIITHEHSDHVKGAGILSRRFNIPLYINKKTYLACSKLGEIENLNFFECGRPFEIDSILIQPFSIPHDAKDPVGLTLKYDNQKIGFATDLGMVTNLVVEHLKDCSLLYLESNHDPEMLINGSYPWHLKQRIKSRTGHLSNIDVKHLLSKLKTDNLKHIILAHLSEENNSPQKAIEEISKSLNTSEISLYVAKQDEPGNPIELTNRTS